MRVTAYRYCMMLLALLALALPVRAQDRVFSGPQPGERTTPFRVLDVTGPNAGKETDPIAAFNGAPAVLVFVHGLERSMAPLMTVIDEYGAQRSDRLRTVFVFLTADRVASEQRLPLVGRSLRMKSPMAISTDGAEGPGNYGLNKQCLLTIVAAKENRVAANFALVQPGIADAPAVLGAIARVIGDPNPPSAEELRARRQAAGPAMRRGRAMDRQPAPADLSRFDLNSPEGLRDAVRTLLAEVQSLRAQVAALGAAAAGGRSGQDRVGVGVGVGVGADPPTPARQSPLPGAAPTDPKLIGMLRSFIQLTNDPATVDRVMREVTEYVKGNADLTRQARDGWTRVLALGYGTPYARQAGKALVEQLQK